MPCGAKSLFVSLAGACLLAACAEIPEGREHPDQRGVGGMHDLRSGFEPAASPGEALEAAAPGTHVGDGEEILEFRRRALLGAARERGSRMGYARRGWEIGGLLERRSSQLDRAFDFARVVPEAPAGAGYVIPPVISRGLDAYEGDDRRRRVSVTDEYLAIAVPGEIRPVRPTWRDYLLFERAPADEPGLAPLPRSQAERTRFAEWFGEGWRAGTGLANAEIASRLERLRRDYEGMLRYRRLVSKGMMDRMVLRDADYGVAGGGGEMRVGNRTVRIVSDAAFRADPRRWSARAIEDRNIPAAAAFPKASRSWKMPKSLAEELPALLLEDAPVSPAANAPVSSVTEAGIPHAGMPAFPAGGIQVSPESDATISSDAGEGASYSANRAALPAGGKRVSPSSDKLFSSGAGEAVQLTDMQDFPAGGMQVSIAPEAPVSHAGGTSNILAAKPSVSSTADSRGRTVGSGS